MALLLITLVLLFVLSILGLVLFEFYTLATGKAPITTYSRNIIARYPGWALGLGFLVVAFVGWLSAHFYACSG